MDRLWMSTCIAVLTAFVLDVTWSATRRPPRAPGAELWILAVALWLLVVGAALAIVWGGM